MTTHQTSLLSELDFERFFSEEGDKSFLKLLEEKIKQFSIAIQNKHGYHVVLRKQKFDTGTYDIAYYVDIKEAGQSYVFITNGHTFELEIYKEVVYG